MRKILLFFVVLSTIFLAWCTVNTDEISYGINEFFSFDDEIADLFKNWKKELLQEQINFENDLKCQERWDVLKSQYSNYHSIYYNTEANTCYVKYYKDNVVKESPINTLYSTKTQQTQQTQKTTQYNTQQTNQQQTSNNNSSNSYDFCKVRWEQYEKKLWDYRYCLKEKAADPSSFKVCLEPLKPSCY